MVPDSLIESTRVREIIKKFGFNLVVSDKISLNRFPKDLRNKTCRRIDYPEKLPKVSVIIVFHNEGIGPLLRTFHSVINRSPEELLDEIIVVDDGSNNEHLGKPLENYIKRWNGVVKLFRNEERKGLILSKNKGARLAKGEVLVFLDAHCEVGLNWLPPLLTPISRNDRLATVPIVDIINGRNFGFEAQTGGDQFGRAQVFVNL